MLVMHALRHYEKNFQFRGYYVAIITVQHTDDEILLYVSPEVKRVHV